jgi:hypothetical protein
MPIFKRLFAVPLMITHCLSFRKGSETTTPTSAERQLGTRMATPTQN